MLTAALAGFWLGLSLIVAIGAQNLFVLRQGIRREHVVLVAAICALSDAALIALGVSGIGAIVQRAPLVVEVVRWAGFAFLMVYAVLAARRAWRGGDEALAPETGTAVADSATAVSNGSTTPALRTAVRPVTRAPQRAASVVLTCLALTWLNPHVYLDTVFLLGSVASTHGGDRWLFAAGAMTASLVWFFGLALGARRLGAVLARPLAWRVLDAVIAVVMVCIAISLVIPA